MHKWFQAAALAAAVLVLVCLCALGWAVLQGYCMYRAATGQAPLAQKIEQVRAQPGYTPLDQLPAAYLNGVIAAEDHRFYRHHGVDPLAICRAVWNNLRAGRLAEGGSTITQQLAKNFYYTQEKRLSRKVAEVFTAWLIEDSCTKHEILELYVNAIYFGDGYTGIGQAAQGYFGRRPGQLTFYQATMLAGIPNAPSAYAPTRRPDLAGQRQAQVVRRMAVCGLLPSCGWGAAPGPRGGPAPAFSPGR